MCCHGDDACRMMQLFGDLEDLESVLGAGKDSSHRHVVGSGSCSALVKLLPQNKDLYVSHDTWNGYNSMLRVIKRYNLRFAVSNLVKGGWSVSGMYVTLNSNVCATYSLGAKVSAHMPEFK